MEPDAEPKAAIEGAMAVGAAYVESPQVGRTTSPELQARYDAIIGRGAHADQGDSASTG